MRHLEFRKQSEFISYVNLCRQIGCVVSTKEGKKHAKLKAIGASE